MQYDLTNLQKNNERRLPAVAKSFLYESKRNFLKLHDEISDSSHNYMQRIVVGHWCFVYFVRKLQFGSMIFKL